MHIFAHTLSNASGMAVCIQVACLPACCWHMCLWSSYLANRFFLLQKKTERERKKQHTHSTSTRTRCESEIETYCYTHECIERHLLAHIIAREKKNSTHTMPVPVHFIRCNRFECWMLNHFFFVLWTFFAAHLIFRIVVHCIVLVCFVVFCLKEMNIFIIIIELFFFIP